MTDNKFTTEYIRSVDSIPLPEGYKSQIISNLKMIKTSPPQKEHSKNSGWIVTSLIAASLVLIIGATAIFSIPRDEELSLKICSADTASALSGATVTLVDGNGTPLADKQGDKIVSTTDAEGFVKVKIPRGLSAKVKVAKEGYISLQAPAKNGNIYISPVLTEDTYRAVLSWEGDYDLDAHLSMKQGDRYEKLFYFKSDILDSNGITIAALDLDSETADKPETVTFNPPQDASFCFTVGSYSALKDKDSLSLYDAKPTVTLYKGDQIVNTYALREGEGANVWQVFQIKNGRLFEDSTTYTVSSFGEIR